MRTVKLLALMLNVLAICSLSRTTELYFYGPGYIGGTTSLGIAPNGELWAANGGRIVVYGADGKYLRLEKVQGHDAILFTADNEPVTANCGFNSFFYYHADQVMRYGSDFGNLSPRDIAIDDQGLIYAIDGGNNRIQKYDMNSIGKPLVAIYNSPAEDPFSHPYSIALNAGNMFITDENKLGVWVLDKDGKFLKHILIDRNCWRIRRGPDGMYVNTSKAGVTVFNPATGEIIRDMNNLPGIGTVLGDTRGFAVDKQGNFYIGHQYHEIRKFSPDGKLLQIITTSYEAILTLPDNSSPGEEITAPLKFTSLATLPAGKIPPAFSITLRPAYFRSEADLGLRNGGGDHSGEWATKQATLLAGADRVLKVTQEEKSLNFTIPADLPVGIYRLLVHADHGSLDGQTEGQAVMRVVSAGISANLTLYVPRQRSVFRRDETMEINAIIRGKTLLPAGTLNFSLAPRQGDSLEFQPKTIALQNFPVPATKQSTLTFRIPAVAFHQGRYLLQAEYSTGGNAMHDTWPLQIVAGIAPTPFNILLPEWGAGYTNLTGPFTGRGMQADAAILGNSGITICDVSISNRGESAQYDADPASKQQVASLMQQASEDPALPAPERFLTPSPLEVEMQEALRNGYGIQRDIWGGWYMNDWGYGQPLGIERDNRGVQLWTQWQRGWPSWLGHRYLCLVGSDRNSPEATAIQKQQGITIPGVQDLNWAFNRQQRQYITDVNTPGLHYWTGIDQDQLGNIYLGCASVIVSYTRDGKFRWKVAAGANNDITVAPDGTVYGANTDGDVAVVSPEGKLLKYWRADDFSSHSPRGICLEKAGTLLLVDQADDGSGRQKVVRYSTDGKFISLLADAKYLKMPEKIAVMPDGNIVVTDSGRGGLVFFKPDGTFIKFFPDTINGTPGGTSAVCVAADGSIWCTLGNWRQLIHVGTDGKLLKSIAHGTFAVGGITYPTSLSMTREGTILVGDIGYPYVSEYNADGTFTGKIYGIDQLIVDVRIDRSRYCWDDQRIIAGLWYPIAQRSGDPANKIQAFARTANTDTWSPLTVEAFSATEYSISVPKMNGSVTLRLILAKAGATPEDPQHTDFTIQVNEKRPATEDQRLSEIMQRELHWKETWARTRMGTLLRWTKLSDQIKPGTQNTAPTNYGGWDNLSAAVWAPFRRDALVAEAENEGTDTGTFPLMSPWYVASYLAGVNAKPAWGSLLEWYWNNPSSFQRPLRDYVLLLGTGASGIGTGKPATMMNDEQTALLAKINDRLRRVGTASMALNLPGQDGVAVFRSFTQEALAPDWTDEAFYTAHAAWYDLLRLHVPTAVVNEDSIELENGAALARRFKAILLPEMRFPLPAKTMVALAAFQKLGGEIWVDLNCRIAIPGAKLLKTRYWPFWVQETYYQYMDRGGMGYDGNFEYWRMKQGSDERLPMLRSAFARFITMPISCDDADVFLQQRQGGTASYIFASNDHFPQKPLLETSINSQSPVPANVPFRLNGAAIYDALSMKPVTEKTIDVAFTNEEPARIWVVLPTPISSVSTNANLLGEQLIATAKVLDQLGKQIPAVIPLEFIITDSANKEQYHIWRATDASGACTVQLPISWQAPQGKWTITVRELLSTKSAITNITVTPRTAPVITQNTATTLIFDQKEIVSWLQKMKGKEVWIALDTNQQDLRTMANELAGTLVERGILAKVINIPDIPELPMILSFSLTPEQQAVVDQVKAGQAIGIRRDTGDGSFVTPGPARAICRPLILLGDPAKNRWLNDIHNTQLQPRNISQNYPGPGRALLQYVWAPFYDGYDAITINATDEPGLRDALATLQKIK